MSRRFLGWVPSSCQVMTRRTQGFFVIAAISASTFARGRRVLPRARVAARSSSFRPALARVVPPKRDAPVGELRYQPGGGEHAALGHHVAQPPLVADLPFRRHGVLLSSHSAASTV